MFLAVHRKKTTISRRYAKKDDYLKAREEYEQKERMKTEKECQIHAGKIMAMFLLMAILLWIGSSALAQSSPISLPETYESKTKLTRGETQVEVTTRCLAPPQPMPPCLGQQFTFMNLVTGKAIAIAAIEGLRDT